MLPAKLKNAKKVQLFLLLTVHCEKKIPNRVLSHSDLEKADINHWPPSLGKHHSCRRKSDRRGKAASRTREGLVGGVDGASYRVATRSSPSSPPSCSTPARSLA